MLGSCASPHLANSVRPHYEGKYGQWLTNDSLLPIVYSPKYNITFYGLEKLHPFDAAKFGKVVQDLEAALVLNAKQLVTPNPVSDETLNTLHSAQYLHKLRTSRYEVAKVLELAPVVMFPMAVINRVLINPMKYHVSGTVLAAALALERGWGLNLGGGMHHAWHSDGSGWCPFADITLAIRTLREASQGQIGQVMVVDLDVHQGNGVERDKLHWDDKQLYIVDAYNAQVFPWDNQAKKAIDSEFAFGAGCDTETYLAGVQRALDKAARECKPDLIVYNAGTDILEGDPLGRVNVSAEGIRQRDEMVFNMALKLNAPICMVLSGGYAKRNHEVVSASIANLLTKFELLKQPATAAAAAASS